MFTGLVELTGKVLSLEPRGESARLIVEAPKIAPELVLGESVAVNGCCLTVTDIADGTFAFDLLMQTLRVTSLGDLQTGSLVNLERAMRLGDRFGGHFVQGHVDDTLRILDFSPHGQDHRLEVEFGLDDALAGGERGGGEEPGHAVRHAEQRSAVDGPLEAEAEQPRVGLTEELVDADVVLDPLAHLRQPAVERHHGVEQKQADDRAGRSQRNRQ